MSHSARILNLAAALALTTLSTSALAQAAMTFKATCQNVGVAPQEPLGDREGHAISVSQYSCRNEGGILDGAIATGMNIYEWDKGVGETISANGVIRKPGAIAVYETSEQKTTLIMVDGKVTGFTGSSKGVYKLATGSLAPLSGKSYTFTYRSIPGGQFTVDTIVH